MLTRPDVPPSDLFSTAPAPTLAVPNIGALFRRYWRGLLVGGAAGLIVAVLYALLATPLYKSTATIMLDTRMNQNLQKQDIIGDTPVDTSFVDSQVEVLTSESVALSVVRQLKLTEDPEFIGPPDHLGALILWTARQWVTTVKDKIGLKSDITLDAHTLRERMALETFLKRLKPARVGLTYVIDIDFESESAEKGALIANTIAKTYMVIDRDARYEATRHANEWLQARLTELRAQASTADHAVQSFKAQNNIVDTGKGLLNQQQLSDLNSQLIAAKTATAEAKARLDRIQGASKADLPDVTVTDALNNNVITRLRSQYLDLVSKESELRTRLGSKHVVVQRLLAEMQELKRSIRTEVDRIADAYASDFQIAVARETSLTSSMNTLVAEAGVNSLAQVKMRDLESTSDAYRTLYDSFLQKFQGTTQQQTIPVTYTRIITEATPPLEKSKPKTLIALAGGLLLGVFAGAGVGLLRELTSDVFRTPRQVESETGFRCIGVLPMITTARRSRKQQKNGLRRSSVPIDYVLDMPSSRFAETIRSIKVLVASVRMARDCKVVGIVSATGGEGKSTVAANLAMLLAAGRSSTLLIDADIRHRGLTKAVVPDADQGLIEAIEQPDRLHDLVYRHERAGLDILPCGTDTASADPSALLGSEHMGLLLKTARETYDNVIIELAPLVSVVDAKAVAHLVDGFVCVVEWGRSKRQLVVESLTQSEAIQDRVLGIVLNKADPVSLKRDEAYKGRVFNSYYLD